MKKVLSLILVLALVIAPIVSLARPSIEATDVDIGLDSAVGTVINVVMYIGYAIAVVMILWLGIQWILATPAKKAELKGRMWSMAIGIVLLVGGVTILNFVWDFADKNKGAIGG